MLTASVFDRVARACILASGSLAFAASPTPPHLVLPPVHEEQDLQASLLSRPFILYGQSYNAPIFADYVPTMKDVQTRPHAQMAMNEYEPLQVGIYVPSGVKTLKNVRAIVDCEIPFHVGHVYHQPKDQLDWQADMAPDKNRPWEGKRHVIPLYVIPTNTISAIGPGGSGAFWLTFKTSKEVRPGIYGGTMKVLADNTEPQQVAFTVAVYPFALPRPRVTYGFYYLPYRTPEQFQGLEFQKQYLRDMAEHGMNSMSITFIYTLISAENYDESSLSTHVDDWSSITARIFASNYMSPGEYDLDGKFNAIRLADAQISLGREAGLVQNDHAVMNQAGNFAIDDRRKGIYVDKWRKYSTQHRWPDFLMYMHDEPQPEHFEEITPHIRRWKSLGVSTTAAIDFLAAFALGHLHDDWIVLAGNITEMMQNEAALMGARLCTYDFVLRSTNAEANRYFSGLYSWMMGLSGNYQWAYMSAARANSQVSFDSNYRLSGPAPVGHVLPSPHGPVPGVGLEGRREGVDDYRYLQLLQARIESAPAGSRAADQARRWVGKLRKDAYVAEFAPHLYNAWGADWVDPHPGISPEGYGEIRAQAAQFIVALPAAEGELNPEPAKVVARTPMPLEEAVYAKASVDECMDLLKSGNRRQKRQAAAALAARDGSEAVRGLPSLIDLLDDPDVRMVALRAISVMKDKAEPALPALRKLIKHEDAFVRSGVVYTFWQIGPAAKGDLEASRSDPDLHIQIYARRFLEELLVNEGE